MDDTQLMVLELGSKHYSCAQIVLLGGLRLLGRENPDLIRAMAGLAQGMGGSGNICGALGGGLCLLALHTAKGKDDELPLESGPLLMEELITWFQEDCCQGGPMTCDALLGTDGGTADRRMQPQQCGALVARVWEKAVGLLSTHGIDPTEGRPE